ncbi:hypothetical protein CDAR_243401, partial [Caerostris darwini]
GFFDNFGQNHNWYRSWKAVGPFQLDRNRPNFTRPQTHENLTNKNNHTYIRLERLPHLIDEVAYSISDLVEGDDQHPVIRLPFTSGTLSCHCPSPPLLGSVRGCHSLAFGSDALRTSAPAAPAHHHFRSVTLLHVSAASERHLRALSKSESSG